MLQHKNKYAVDKTSKLTEPKQDIVRCPDLASPRKPVSSRSVERKYDEHDPKRKPTEEKNQENCCHHACYP